MATPPPDDMLAAMEETHASNALRTQREAAAEQGRQLVAAFDHVPFTSVQGVFTLDTSTDVMLLHDARAEVLGGGLVKGSGRMWVAP